MRQHNIFGKDGWVPGRTSGHRRPKKCCKDIVRGIVTGRDNVKGKEILHRASPEKLQKKEERKIVKRLCRGQLLQTSSNLPPLLLDSVLTQFPILVFLWRWHFYRRKLYQRTGQQEKCHILSVYGRHYCFKKLEHIQFNNNHDIGTKPKMKQIYLFCPSGSETRGQLNLMAVPAKKKHPYQKPENLKERRPSVVWKILLMHCNDVNHHQHKKFWDQIILRRHFVPWLNWHIYGFETQAQF